MENPKEHICWACGAKTEVNTSGLCDACKKRMQLWMEDGKKESEIKKCPICGGEGRISVTTYIKKDGVVIPLIIAPCPRCINPY